MAASKINFEEGEKVIYPNHGICIIEKIKEETIGGISDTFYSIKVIDTGSSLFIPSSNVETVGLRSPIKKSEIKKAYQRVENGEVKVYSKWKNRYEENLRMMGTGILEDIIDVLKSLFYVASSKTLSFREKKMQEKALDLLASEIALTGKDDKEKTETKLTTVFEKAIEKFIESQD